MKTTSQEDKFIGIQTDRKAISQDDNLIGIQHQINMIYFIGRQSHWKKNLQEEKLTGK